MTVAREEFQAQVPEFVPLSKDATVLASGVCEVGLGLALVFPAGIDERWDGSPQDSSRPSSPATSPSGTTGATASVWTPTESARFVCPSNRRSW